MFRNGPPCFGFMRSATCFVLSGVYTHSPVTPHALLKYSSTSMLASESACATNARMSFGGTPTKVKFSGSVTRLTLDEHTMCEKHQAEKKGILQKDMKVCTITAWPPTRRLAPARRHLSATQNADTETQQEIYLINMSLYIQKKRDAPSRHPKTRWKMLSAWRKQMSICRTKNKVSTF